MKNALKQFLEYSLQYKYLGINIKRKIQHTLRVMMLCEDIAKKQGFSEEEVYLCKLGGLLHDIGRFEQYKQYHTYVDAKSMDHGDYGYFLLQDEKWMTKFQSKKEYDDVLRKAVKYHNKYALPSDLLPLEEKVCKVVRDADKIAVIEGGKCVEYGSYDELMALQGVFYKMKKIQS